MSLLSAEKGDWQLDYVTPCRVVGSNNSLHWPNHGCGSPENGSPTIAPRRVPLKPKIPVRTVEMRPLCFVTKKSLTEGEENKTAAERGGAQLLGTSFASFYHH